MPTLAQTTTETKPARVDSSVTEAKVAELVRRLVEAYDPVRVVAFGSWARGEAGPYSDFDVAVLVDGERPRVGGITLGIDMATDILVRPVERARRYASVAGNIYHAIATEGLVLYDRDPARSEPFYGTISEEDHMESKVEILKGKLRKAASDEKALHIEELDHEVRGFHGQQAVEKLMKVWLMGIDLVPQHIHDLNELNKQLKKNGLELPELRTNFTLLTEYAAYWRYEEIREDKRVDLDVLREDVVRLRGHVVDQLTRLGLDVAGFAGPPPVQQ